MLLFFLVLFVHQDHFWLHAENFWHHHHPFSIIDFRISDFVVDTTKPKWILSEALLTSWVNFLQGKLTDVDFSTTGKILRQILSDEDQYELAAGGRKPEGKRMSLKVALSGITGTHRSLTTGQGMQLGLRSARVTLHTFDLWDCAACKSHGEILLLKTSPASFTPDHKKKQQKAKGFLSCTIQLPPSRAHLNNGLDDHLSVVCLRLGTVDLILDPIFWHWNEYRAPAVSSELSGGTGGSRSLGDMASVSAFSSSKKTSAKGSSPPPKQEEKEKPPWIASSLIQIEVSPSQIVVPLEHLHHTKDHPGVSVEDSAGLSSSHFLQDSRSSRSENLPETLIIHLPALRLFPQQPYRPLNFEEVELPVLRSDISKDERPQGQQYIPIEVQVSSFHVETITQNWSSYSLRQNRAL